MSDRIYHISAAGATCFFSIKTFLLATLLVLAQAPINSSAAQATAPLDFATMGSDLSINGWDGSAYTIDAVTGEYEYDHDPDDHPDDCALCGLPGNPAAHMQPIVSEDISQQFKRKSTANP